MSTPEHILLTFVSGDNCPYLDVVDDQVVGVEALVLGIGLCVLEEVEEELGRLLGPTSLRGAVNLGLRN